MVGEDHGDSAPQLRRLDLATLLSMLMLTDLLSWAPAARFRLRRARDSSTDLAITTFRQPNRIENFSELHELGLFTDEQYRKTFSDEGFTVEYDPVGLFNRGLYLGSAPKLTSHGRNAPRTGRVMCRQPQPVRAGAVGCASRERS
jgi:hypothetical protein